MSHLTKTKENVTPKRLVSLKVLVFLFFGALQCMYAFLPYHMKVLGFKLYDIRLITLISGLVSIIGPLVIGFFLDRIAIKRPSAYGKWLRILLFIFFILAGLMFGSLLLVPAATPSQDTPVTFSCNDHGGFVYIRKIETIGDCQNLAGRTGKLKLTNCSYTCESPENFKNLYNQTVLFENSPENSSENSTLDDDYDESSPPLEPEALIQARPTEQPKSIIPPPHICVTNSDHVHCHVYLEGTEINLINMVGAKNEDDDTNMFIEDWCKHPLEKFSCNVPQAQITWMKSIRYNEKKICTPAVECHVTNPYGEQSVLHYIERAANYSGHPVPYELYFTLRIIAEIFPVIIHMLLNISLIIVTCETSTGRGNIGHQWVFYPIGVLVFATVIGLINHALPYDVESFFVPVLTFSISMLICAIVLLFSGKLPLTPSDWWWHTKCGMLAIPMSALKRYKWVIAAIASITLVLGGLWYIQEAYRHLFTIDLIENAIIGDGKLRSKAFVYIIGAVLSIPLIWNGEKIVDCLGHSNIFILGFVSFALRFAGLYFDNRTSLTTLYEIMEPLSFYLPWLALILFTRHLVPKKLLAFGQALLVILFFSLGRAIGFFYGTSIIADDLNNQNELNDLQTIHTIAATIACIAAIIYFTIYHCILLPYFHVPNNQLATNKDTNVSPQRVFHDERSRKGYFRY